jgi:hypothetical protein
MTTLITARLRQVLILAGLAAPTVSTGLSQAPQQVVSPVDTFMVIVPARPINEIKQDIEVLDALRARKKAQLDELKTQKVKGESEIDLKASEINLLKSRQDAADQQNNDAEVGSLKNQINGVDRIRDLLKERQDLYSAEISAAEAALDYAKAAEDMFDKEIALAKKREELTSQVGAGAGKSFVAGGNQALLNFENSVLSAQSEKLKKQEKMLSEDRDVVEKQQELAEMQGRMLAK